MTPEEAREVLAIMAKADGGCPYCVSELFIKFRKKFIDHTQIVNEMIVELKLEEYVGDLS